MTIKGLQEAMDKRKYLYALTDGNEIFRVKAMTPAEAAEAGKNSRRATDENVDWKKLSGLNYTGKELV